MRLESLVCVPEATGGLTHYGLTKGLQRRPDNLLGRPRREEEDVLESRWRRVQSRWPYVQVKNATP